MEESRRTFMQNILAASSLIARTLPRAALLLALLMSGPAWAQPGPPHGGPPPEHRGGRPGGGPPGGPHGIPLDQALEELTLPEDVREDVDTMLDEAHQRRRTLHRSLRQAHDVMRGLLEAAEPDETAILAQADEIGRLRTELDKTRLLTLLRINRRLSPEQKEALTQALGARNGKGRPGGGPPGRERLGDEAGPGRSAETQGP
jgi:Spy/CpxP family protein refolding chaperone